MSSEKIVYNLVMSQDIYSLAFALKELLNDDPRLIRLNELEKKMNESEEVMALSYQKDVAVSRYSDALNHYLEDSKEVKEAQSALHEKKLALDEHPLVREYLKAYSEVRDLYFLLNDILFSGLNIHLKECK